MYKIICLVIFRAMSLDADVAVCTKHNTTIMLTQFPLKFECDSTDWFIKKLFIENKPSSVTAVKANDTVVRTFDADIKILSHSWRTGQKYYVSGTGTYVKLWRITLHLYRSKGLCKERRDHSELTNEEIMEYRGIDKCKYKNCELIVDLKNECDDSPSATDAKNNDKKITKPMNDFIFNTISRNEHLKTTQNSTPADDKEPPFPPKNVVIISVIVIFIIILVITICVKKCCRRKSEPVETIEMNTNVTTNEVVYADLSLAHGDSSPPRQGDESTYAQIIGVLKPADAVVKK